MNKKNFRNLSPRIFWIVTLSTAVLLTAIVAIPQWLSKRARMDVLRSHVAQIAQLAASVVDGDLHRQLLDPANYTPELYARNFYDRALVDILVKSKGHIKSRLW